MITNLVASIIVTLVTNTTETVSKHWATDPCPIAAVTPNYGCLVNHGHFESDKNPTSKTIATEILERKTVTFTLGDESWSSFKERSVTNWTEAFSLKTESKWAAVQPPPGVPRMLILTNLPRATPSNALIWVLDGKAKPSGSTYQ